jgi:ribulose-phosphate 3-epimerase
VKRVFIHVEIKNMLDNLIAFKEFGFRTGLAISPQTKIEKVKPYAQFADSFMLMAVKPGKEGQKFIASTPSRVSQLRKIAGSKEILVDGGIDLKTIGKLHGAGAVVGSDLSDASDPRKEFLILRRRLQ